MSLDLTKEVETRLATYSAQTVEAQLDSTYDGYISGAERGDSGVSLLQRLTRPGEGRTQADALKDILEDIGEYTENAAVTTAMVWRYAEIHQIWKTHSVPEMRNRENFLKHLDHNAVVKMNIQLGTSTVKAKQGSINIINNTWGEGWWDRIPERCRPPYPAMGDVSKRILMQIAANCKQGLRMEDAVKAWDIARNERLDPVARRASKRLDGKAKGITAQDVASALDGRRMDKGRRTVEQFFPELDEDRVELKTMQLTQPVADEPTGPAPEGATRKRQRVVVSDSEEDENLPCDRDGKPEDQGHKRRRLHESGREVEDEGDGEADQGEDVGQEVESEDVEEVVGRGEDVEQDVVVSEDAEDVEVNENIEQDIGVDDVVGQEAAEGSGVDRERDVFLVPNTQDTGHTLAARKCTASTIIDTTATLWELLRDSRKGLCQGCQDALGERVKHPSLFRPLRAMAERLNDSVERCSSF